MREGSGHRRWRFLIGAVCLALAVSVPAIALGATLTPVYRFYNTKAGTHFYTASETEKNTVQSTMGATYTFEGVAYNLETDNPQMNTPLYRFYNRVTGTHFYTASETEKNTVMATMAATFTYEGVAYNVSSIAAGNTPVYRFYNKKTGTHFYTASETEKANIQATLSGTYTYEGPAFYLAYTAAPPTGDTTAPTTTSNAELLYRGPATIVFSAVDNTGGSGVAATYYTLDGFGPVAGTMAYASGFGAHTVEFWSVDVAGNVETKNVVTFSIVSVHASPAIAACTDCHTSDIMTLHANNCVYCHGTGITPSFDCADCHEPASSPNTHPNLATVHDATGQTCVGAECHAATVTDIHGTNCAACHGAGITPTVVCATCHTPFHTALPGAHAVTGQSCIAAGCHVSTDAPTLHAGACLPCHGPGITPSLVCADCHEPKTSLDTHPLMPTAHDATGQTCVAAGCHDKDAAVIHDTMLGNGLTPPSCEACHNGAPLTIVCSTCHGDYASIHPAQGATVHRVTGFCYTSGCHVMTAGNTSDAALIHASWADAPGCAACHATGVTPKLTCFDAACHGAGGASVETVHAYVHPSAAGDRSEGCTISECHGSTNVLALTDDVTRNGHTGCLCHTYDSPDLNVVIAAGMNGEFAECMDCHDAPFDGAAPHPFHVTSHDAIDIAGAESSACVSCHGDDVMAVGSREVAGGDVTVPADPLAPVQEHLGCSCHANYSLANLTTIKSECTECHTGGAAAHGFTNGDVPWNPNDYIAAGGHNTTTFDLNGGAEHFGATSIVIKDSKGATIEQHWPRPTVGVFWSQTVAVYSDGTTESITTADFTGSLNPTDSPVVAMGARTNRAGVTKDLSTAIRTDITWDSVITCYDCHTELEGLVGPQGANAANYGLDPNFPDDWTRAELTSFDPTGMRSIETKQSSPNKYYQKWGSRQWWPEVSTDTTVQPLIAGNSSTNATIYAGGNYGATATSANGYAAGNVEGAFLCQKCHKLVNSYQGLAIEGNGSGFRSNNLANIGYGNYPHMEHHGDMITGQGNCVSCHVAIPHGWKRPRLLVYGSDPAPFKTQWVYSYYQTKGTALDQAGTANDRNADLGAAIAPQDFGYGVQSKQGNWGYLGANTLTNTYGLIGATVNVNGTVSNNPNNAGSWPVLLTAHLDGISAGVDSHKAIENPGVDEGREFEATFNAQPAVIAAGMQVTWSKWAWEEHGTFGGVEWHTDNTPGANGYNIDPTLNTQHYNNCNGCTSANSSRHTPHNAGINPDVASWK